MKKEVIERIGNEVLDAIYEVQGTLNLRDQYSDQRIIGDIEYYLIADASKMVEIEVLINRRGDHQNVEQAVSKFIADNIEIKDINDAIRDSEMDVWQQHGFASESDYWHYRMG